MINNFSLEEILYLMHHLHDAIVRSFSPSSTHEPQMIANLVYNLPRLVNNYQWEGDFKVGAAGIFIHAKPFVKSDLFPENKSVELGDLLLLTTIVDSSKNVVHSRRALLLQAKKASKLPASPDNKNQYYLYENWPEFEYTRSKDLNGKKRRVIEPDIYDGAKYLLIADKGSFPFCCNSHHYLFAYDCLSSTAKPTRPLSHYNCFVDELVNFILGNYGKEVVYPSPDNDIGWNRVVEDLIQNTQSAASKFIKRAGDSNSSRQQGMFCMFTGNTSASESSVLSNFMQEVGPPRDSDVPPTDIPREFNYDDEGGGISIIEFTVKVGL